MEIKGILFFMYVCKYTTKTLKNKSHHKSVVTKGKILWTLLSLLAFFSSFRPNNEYKPLVILIHGFGEIINKKKLF